jgi:hypothetical protein
MVLGPLALGLGPSLVVGVLGPWSFACTVEDMDECAETKRQGPGTTKDQARTKDEGPRTKD